MRARTCIARSLCIGSAASLVLDSYTTLLIEHPLTTNIATAGALAAAGDAVAQRNNVVYDAKRGLSFVAFDAAYRGGFQTPLFPWIIDHCHGDVAGQVLSIDTNICRGGVHALQPAHGYTNRVLPPVFWDYGLRPELGY